MYRVQCLLFLGVVRKFRRSWSQHFQQKQLLWTVPWISCHGWGYIGPGFWIPLQNGKNPNQHWMICHKQSPLQLAATQISPLQIANPYLTWYLEQPCLTVKSFVRSYWHGQSRTSYRKELTSDGSTVVPSWQTLLRKWWKQVFWDRPWKVDTIFSMMKTKFSKIVLQLATESSGYRTLQKKKTMILWECEMYKYPPDISNIKPVTCNPPFRWIHIHSCFLHSADTWLRSAQG